MDAALRRLVRDRSGGRCEYCRLPEGESLVPFEIEHIIARKHRGRTVASNLAWACVYWKSQT
jgi:putative hemolysin